LAHAPNRPHAQAIPPALPPRS